MIKQNDIYIYIYTVDILALVFIVSGLFHLRSPHQSVPHWLQHPVHLVQERGNSYTLVHRGSNDFDIYHIYIHIYSSFEGPPFQLGLGLIQLPFPLLMATIG